MESSDKTARFMLSLFDLMIHTLGISCAINSYNSTDITAVHSFMIMMAIIYAANIVRVFICMEVNDYLLFSTCGAELLFLVIYIIFYIVIKSKDPDTASIGWPYTIAAYLFPSYIVLVIALICKSLQGKRGII